MRPFPAKPGPTEPLQSWPPNVPGQTWREHRLKIRTAMGARGWNLVLRTPAFARKPMSFFPSVCLSRELLLPSRRGRQAQKSTNVAQSSGRVRPHEAQSWRGNQYATRALRWNRAGLHMAPSGCGRMTRDRELLLRRTKKRRGRRASTKPDLREADPPRPPSSGLWGCPTRCQPHTHKLQKDGETGNNGGRGRGPDGGWSSTWASPRLNPSSTCRRDSRARSIATVGARTHHAQAHRQCAQRNTQAPHRAARRPGAARSPNPRRPSLRNPF